jgi:hypothetical protein
VRMPFWRWELVDGRIVRVRLSWLKLEINFVVES